MEAVATEAGMASWLGERRHARGPMRYPHRIMMPPERGPALKMAIEQRDTPDMAFRQYSNGYKTFGISDRERVVARDSNYVEHRVAHELKPDYEKEILSDKPDLTFQTADGAPEDVAEDSDPVKTHTFQPKGKMFNGLYVYDRKDVEKCTGRKDWEPIIWTRPAMAERLMVDTRDRAERDVCEAAGLPASAFASAAWSTSEASNAIRATAQASELAAASMRTLQHQFELFDRDFSRMVRRRGWGDPQTMPRTRGNGRRILTVKDGPEGQAMLLLLRMIGEQAFRSYVKNGFVTYRAASGLFYQIFPGTEMVRVWNRGQPVEKLCLVFQDYNLPPTDAVIMRLLMLEHDEEGFRKMAVKYPFTPPRQAPRAEEVAQPGRIAAMAAERVQVA